MKTTLLLMSLFLSLQGLAKGGNNPDCLEGFNNLVQEFSKTDIQAMKDDELLTGLPTTNDKDRLFIELHDALKVAADVELTMPENFMALSNKDKEKFYIKAAKELAQRKEFESFSKPALALLIHKRFSEIESRLLPENSGQARPTEKVVKQKKSFFKGKKSNQKQTLEEHLQAIPKPRTLVRQYKKYLKSFNDAIDTLTGQELFQFLEKFTANITAEEALAGWNDIKYFDHLVNEMDRLVKQSRLTSEQAFTIIKKTYEAHEEYNSAGSYSTNVRKLRQVTKEQLDRMSWYQDHLAKAQELEKAQKQEIKIKEQERLLAEKNKRQDEEASILYKQIENQIDTLVDRTPDKQAQRSVEFLKMVASMTEIHVTDGFVDLLRKIAVKVQEPGFLSNRMDIQFDNNFGQILVILKENKKITESEFNELVHIVKSFAKLSHDTDFNDAEKQAVAHILTESWPMKATVKDPSQTSFQDWKVTDVNDYLYRLEQTSQERSYASILKERTTLLNRLEYFNGEDFSTLFRLTLSKITEETNSQSIHPRHEANAFNIASNLLHEKVKRGGIDFTAYAYLSKFLKELVLQRKKYTSQDDLIRAMNEVINNAGVYRPKMGQVELNQAYNESLASVYSTSAKGKNVDFKDAFATLELIFELESHSDKLLKAREFGLAIISNIKLDNSDALKLLDAYFKLLKVNTESIDKDYYNVTVNQVISSIIENMPKNAGDSFYKKIDRLLISQKYVISDLPMDPSEIDYLDNANAEVTIERLIARYTYSHHTDDSMRNEFPKQFAELIKSSLDEGTLTDLNLVKEATQGFIKLYNRYRRVGYLEKSSIDERQASFTSIFPMKINEFLTEFSKTYIDQDISDMKKVIEEIRFLANEDDIQKALDAILEVELTDDLFDEEDLLDIYKSLTTQLNGRNLELSTAEKMEAIYIKFKNFMVDELEIDEDDDTYLGFNFYSSIHKRVESLKTNAEKVTASFLDSDKKAMLSLLYTKSNLPFALKLFEFLNEINDQEARKVVKSLQDISDETREKLLAHTKVYKEAYAGEFKHLAEILVNQHPELLLKGISEMVLSAKKIKKTHPNWTYQLKLKSSHYPHAWFDQEDLKHFDIEVEKSKENTTNKGSTSTQII